MTNALAEYVENNEASIEQNAPEGYTADKLKRLALMLRDKPHSDLAECTPASLVRSVLRAVHLGLDIERGEAYLVAYNEKYTKPDGSKGWRKAAQLQPSYTGLVRIAKANPSVADIKADVVREGDTFTYRRTTDAVAFEHTPVPFSDEEIIGAYVVVELTDALNRIERMSRSEIDTIRSKASDKSGAWNQFFGEMAKKSVTRRAMKWLDLDPEARALIHEGDRAEYDFDTDTSPPQVSTDRPQSINAMLEAGDDKKPTDASPDAADKPEDVDDATEVHIRLQSQTVPDDARDDPDHHINRNDILFRDVMMMTPHDLRQPFAEWLRDNRPGDTETGVATEALRKLVDKLNGLDEPKVVDLIESWIY